MLYNLLLSVLGLALVVDCTTAAVVGTINVKGYGDIYVVADGGNVNNIQIHDNGFTLNGPSGLYFADKPSDTMDPNIYWKVPLNDKHFAYTIDVSNVGCHCNSAAYFVQMPATSPGEWGIWYCDANFVNGNWCPEYDVWEGNRHTMVSTLHTCSGDPGNWWECDRGGCGTNAFNYNPNMMCPEDRCTINTNRPFTISHNQNSGYVNVWMSQEGREASFNICSDGGYMANMASSYQDMVFVASLWGGGGIDMGWLDGMTGCQGECDIQGSSVTFTNFELW